MSNSLAHRSAEAQAPVSVKAVLMRDGTVLLGENDRGEWELLGGRPEAGESFVEALGREVQEEAGLRVDVGEVVLDELFEVVPGRLVRIIAYRCQLSGPSVLRPSAEHRSIAWVPLVRLDLLRLPTAYRAAIDAVAR